MCESGLAPTLFFGCQVPTLEKTDLKDRLTNYRQIKISVMGRKSRRTISTPVWFVLEGEKLYAG